MADVRAFVTSRLAIIASKNTVEIGLSDTTPDYLRPDFDFSFEMKITTYIQGCIVYSSDVLKF